MGKKFDIPNFYRSSVIALLKQLRKTQDPRKRDFTPTELDLGNVKFKIARHFGFCYGVENAIEIAYRALEENPGKRVFLLSEMIHNPQVNADLNARGVKFLQTTEGKQLIDFNTLTKEDVVIVPAFGTTVELFERLRIIGIDPYRYNATCPFVEKVWKRSDELGRQGFSVIIHGKEVHEETRATFSHAKVNAPSLVIRDMKEAQELACYLRGEMSEEHFNEKFGNRVSPNFDPKRDLERIGVVNQTTMLATETLAISDVLKEAVRVRRGDSQLKDYFADTRDTLCYATWDNQEAVNGMISAGGDVAIVVGGYNSSNTSHLVELLEEHYPTYYVKDPSDLISRSRIKHLKWRTGEVVESEDWLPHKPCLTIMITAGASCPDSIVDAVISKTAELLGVDTKISDAISTLQEQIASTGISGL